jgi:enamine deaminase RidA (YjgF/YER057c/UK114 family)
MSLERVNPAALAPPRGFSHAVVGTGRFICLAGQTALDADGQIVGHDVVSQFRQALTNLLTALDAAGGHPDELASVTVYVVDMADYQEQASELGRVWRKSVGSHYPAMAGVEVSRLWDADALVELQGFAITSRE